MLQCRSCNNILQPVFKLNEQGKRTMKYQCGCSVAEPKQEFEIRQQEVQDEYEAERKAKKTKEAHAQNVQKLGPHLADLLRPKDMPAAPVPYEQPKFEELLKKDFVQKEVERQSKQIEELMQKINQHQHASGMPVLTVPKGSEVAEIGALDPSFFPNPAFQPGDMVVVDGKGPYTITFPDKKINQLVDMMDAGIISKEDAKKILKEFKP